MFAIGIIYKWRLPKYISSGVPHYGVKIVLTHSVKILKLK